MSDIKIMKAVEYDKLPVKFKKANPFESLRDRGYWLQKKYDGCFGMAVIRNDGTSQMLSRTGEDYSASCGHILDELRDAGEQAGELSQGNPAGGGFVVLGEVWQEGVDFPTISGRFRKRAPSKLQFVANDLLPIGLETGLWYRSRYVDLSQLLPKVGVGSWWCSVAQTYEADEWGGSAMEAALHWKNEGGYDGAILRNPNAGYTIGLVKNGEIIKVKPVMSLDLAVTECRIAYGEKTGREVYTLTVVYRGVVTDVGSGMPHSRDALPQIGDIVEIECMGITEDGKLREPRFKGVRHDKTQPDA